MLTSGTQMEGLLDSHPTGPVLLTGGSFGTEGSLLTVVVCLVAAAFLVRLARRNGRMVPARRHRGG